MEIHLTCTHCGKKLSAPADRAGKRGRCPGCQQTFVVPSTDPVGPPSVTRRPPSTARKDAQPLFPRRIDGPDHELIDMTAMVDIVFFLLIFFMVTSMHSLQSSIALPTPEADAEQGTRRAAQADDGDQIIVQVDSDDTVAVDGEEVPSRQELIARLRAAERDNLLVMASGDAMHGTVVMVLDAGSDAGMQQIRLISEGLDNE
jgi:biopolymer transport protein ExbD